MWLRVERWLLGLTVLAGVGMMWLAPRLPMGDLAQHAGQVALWRDLLTGQSPWSELVRINLMTPYLIGYGLMLPISFVFSMEDTTRIAISLGFLSFVAAAITLRRQLGSDRRLDWMFLLSYFGFAWKWGFLTFLLASPVGLVFLVLAHRHGQVPALRRGIALWICGLVLLFSHGLIFLAMVWLGGMLALHFVVLGRPRRPAARLWPYVALSACALLFRLLTQDMNGAMQIEGFDYGTPILKRFGYLLVCLGDMNNTGSMALPLLTVLGLALPFLLGLKANRREALVLAGSFALLLAMLPTDALQTGLLFPRFALFVPPMLAIAFAAAPQGSQTSARSLAALGLAMIAVWSVLVIQASRIHSFARESRPFETLLAAAEPGKRALAMVFELESDAAVHDSVYMHYASWYQADKHGFVDFNIADFHPQVVRFKPGKSPGINQLFGWNPEKYAFSGLDMTIYTYFFVRGSSGQVGKLKRSSPCNVQTLAEDHEWYLLEQSQCPVKWPVQQN